MYGGPQNVFGHVAYTWKYVSDIIQRFLGLTCIISIIINTL